MYGAVPLKISARSHNCGTSSTLLGLKEPGEEAVFLEPSKSWSKSMRGGSIL